jgi:hypothetical protein
MCSVDNHNKYWDKVEEYLENAKGIAFDECHKIYVLMDDEQMALMKEYEYDPLISAEGHTIDELIGLLKKWYYNSCGLRFINAVYTNTSDPNLGFVDLIPQGAEQTEEDEDEDE